jgi:hypothetical protein
MINAMPAVAAKHPVNQTFLCRIGSSAVAPKWE